MDPTRIQKLPEEIIAEICSYLVLQIITDENKSEQCVRRYTLANACLVSKAFRRIAQPLMYRVVDLTYEGQDFGSLANSMAMFTGPPGTQDLPWSLRWRAGQDSFAFNSAFNSDRALSPSAMASVNWPEGLSHQLLHRLQGPSASPVSLHLCLCRNIEVVQLETDSSEAVQLALDVVQEMYASNPQLPLQHPLPLQNLRELTIDGLHGRHPMESVDAFVILLHLPCIHTFRASYKVCDRPAAFEGIKSSVQNMELQAIWHMNGPTLAALLQACPRLVTLSIGWSGMQEIDVPMFYEKLIEAIDLHGQTLTSLTLDTERLYTGPYSEQLARERMPTLRGMQNLVLLSLTEFTLTGRHPVYHDFFFDWGTFDHLLPVSLETLCIYNRSFDDGVPLERFLIALLDDEDLANLQRIRLINWKGFENDVRKKGWDVTKGSMRHGIHGMVDYVGLERRIPAS